MKLNAGYYRVGGRIAEFVPGEDGTLWRSIIDGEAGDWRGPFKTNRAAWNDALEVHAKLPPLPVVNQADELAAVMRGFGF